MLSLSSIKDLYTQGMQYAKDKYPGLLYDRCDSLCDYQIDLVNKAQDINTVMNAIWIGNINYVWSTAFKGPKPICVGCELAYSGIQYGTAPVGWYFFYGTHGQFCFNLTFFRLEIAPGSIVDKNNIPKPQAVRWNILGGFGTTGTEPTWTSIQSEWIEMDYSTFTPEYSTFMLNGFGKNITAQLRSDSPMTFVIQLTFNSADGKSHTLNVSMMGNTPPNANVSKSCECGFGLGSFYYSYPRTSCYISVDGVASPNEGVGWVDHQLIKPGIANSLFGQAFQTVSNLLTRNISGGWLWTTIQDDQSGIQYMFTHFFAKKFYQDDISPNVNIPNSMINVYKKGLPYFNPTTSGMDSSDVRMVLTKTVLSTYTGMNMPASYNITLPGGKQVVLSINTAPNVYPTAFAPYETPALLYDTNGNIIGQGLIEANFYFDNDTMVKRLIQFAGGDSTNQNEVNIVMNALLKKQSFLQKLLSVLIILIPVFIVLLCGIFIFKSDQKKIRSLLILSVLLILIMLYAVKQ